MADLTQKLTLIAELLGDKEVVANLQKLVAAQQGVAGAAGQQAPAVSAAGEAVTALGEAAGEAAGKQEEHTLAMDDFLGVLRAIDPRLASMARGLLNAAVGMGELGSKAIDFSAVGTGLVGIVTKFGSTLGLLAAGGALAAGIGAITAAWAKMGAELEKVNAKIKDQQDAMNALKRAEGERKQAIEDISDARKRGGFDAATARAADEQIGRVLTRNPALDAEAAKKAAGHLGDVGLSDEEMASATFLMQTGRLQLTGKESKQRARARFDKAAGRNREAVESQFRREAKQRYDTAEEAFREKQSIGGGKTALEDLAREALGKGVTDEQVKAAIAKLEEKGGFKAIEAGLVSLKNFGGQLSGGMRKVTRAPSPEEADAIKIGRLLDKRLREGPTSSLPVSSKSGGEHPIAPDVPTVTPDIKEAVDETKGMMRERIKKGEPTSINIHNEFNSKKIVPGAAYQTLVRVNGESAAREAEIFP